MASYQGTFLVPPTHTVEVLFHFSGLEEYKVDGQSVLTSRAWEVAGYRDFKAGDNSVRIRFSLLHLYCKAYVNGKLVTRDVFPRMKKQRGKLRAHRKDGKHRNPAWVTFVFWFLFAYIVMGVYDRFPLWSGS